jgi:hypothetical protein
MTNLAAAMFFRVRQPDLSYCLLGRDCERWGREKLTECGRAQVYSVGLVVTCIGEAALASAELFRQRGVG